MRLKALVEIYTMHSFAQLQNRIFFLRPRGPRCSPGPASGPDAIRLLVGYRVEFGKRTVRDWP